MFLLQVMLNVFSSVMNCFFLFTINDSCVGSNYTKSHMHTHTHTHTHTHALSWINLTVQPSTVQLNGQRLKQSNVTVRLLSCRLIYWLINSLELLLESFLGEPGWLSRTPGNSLSWLYPHSSSCKRLNERSGIINFQAESLSIPDQ